MPSLIPPGVRAVVFDAVGTLIHPEPAAGVVYAQVGSRFGSHYDAAKIQNRFAAAFHRQEDIDRAAGLRTDEAREVARWRAIVAEVLYDVGDAEACFHHLYEHFARPAAWRTDPDARATLSVLTARGYQLGIASNFDDRLVGLVAANPVLQLARNVIVSAAVGWRKPAAEFFAAVGRELGMDSPSILFVGDDRDNDYDGARRAGMPAVLFDPRGRASADVRRIGRLSELLAAGE